MAEQDHDRSEQATPYKLEQARGKGSVAKSVDLVYVGVLCALLVFFFGYGWHAVNQILTILQAVLNEAGRSDWSANGIMSWLGAVLLALASPLAPLLLSVMIAAVVTSLAQTGPVFSVHPIKPDWNKLNPATGFKRFFSMRIVYESGKSVLKLVVIGAVLAMGLLNMRTMLVALPNADVHQYGRVLLEQCGSLLFKMAMVMAIFAIVDFAFARWEYLRQMRMSRRDIRDEHKMREGDPRIRSRLRELRMEFLKRTKGLAQIPESDVLITNPVHYAVAVRYKHGDMLAPQVVAKGAGGIVTKMKQVAARHNVVVVQNPPLARALFRQVDTEQYVPESLYPEVAKILVWIYAMRRARANQQGSAA
ncbi:flagellar biosynthetic protein FlhB [Andreprevotia lacus DSM 23236]|jgi:flagellar biosynthetic protein FlhB|uniref:Flagellar biosynthetic protein FlhB n=1 Tax=Andreprevotia lacus DSM 23236 TaxID=1121001 RepID=A0A1W1XV37_9NEIS|nr:EscU/YscU/HrcU family type III secretion system export apparatus switch protein [Andreprevotia lacus]SMC27704.1 flagellar biosynthetic protein FlhB [Andreprevotia lacus DSM 23236]